MDSDPYRQLSGRGQVWRGREKTGTEGRVLVDLLFVLPLGPVGVYGAGETRSADVGSLGLWVGETKTPDVDVPVFTRPPP